LTVDGWRRSVMDQATYFFCKKGIKIKKLSNEITIRKAVCITRSPVDRQPSTVNQFNRRSC